MPRLDSNALFAWLDHLKGKTYIYLVEPSLKEAQYFRHMELDNHLLRAAASYWDPITHVFLFGEVEISPLFKEFISIMGIFTDDSDAPLLPIPQPGYVAQLAKMLNFPRSAAKALISNGEVNVAQIASHFHYNTIMWCEGYLEALVLYIACQFAFSSRSHSIIPLILAMLKRQNPMAICLAETLMGLDEAHTQGATLLRGSLYILRIWLWK